MHAINTLLFSNGKPWVKKDRDRDFDVLIGWYNGVEICEIIGTYSFYQTNVISENKYKIE